MSLSFTDYGNGLPIAWVKNDDKPKQKKMLYMYAKKVADEVLSLQLDGDEISGDTFEKAVDTSQEREVLYVSGMSGAGKSFWCRQYIEKYHKKYPKRLVYVFSSLTSCKTLDKLKYLKRIKINEPEFMNRNLTANDFKESLVLFDDIDVINNKKIKAKTYDIMNSCLQIGRHSQVTCLVTSHNSTNGADTKITLNEATSIVLFPKASGNKSLLYISDSYLGLDSKQAKDLKKIDGRFVCIVRNHPRCVFSLKRINLISG